MASGFNPTPSTKGLAAHAEGLPADWKWAALLAPPAGFEAEWRAWLAQAQQEEERSTLAHWAKRPK